MRTYLVTGGAGFIGSNFIRLLLNDNDVKIVNIDALTYAGSLDNLEGTFSDRHVFIKADICDSEAVNDCFRKYDIDIVVHFAAESHVDRSITDPEVFVRTNVLGTATLLNSARKYWGKDGAYKPNKKFIQVSTDEVYGSLGKTGYFTETTPLAPRSPYSASKAAADLLALSYHETYGFPVVVTRCSNNYGPYQFPEKLIPLMILNTLDHKKLPVYGDGKNVRDWLFVADHCKALLLVAEQGKNGEVYNIGGDNEKTNIDIVNLIIDTVRETLREDDPRKDGISKDLIAYVADRLGHDRRYAIDHGKITAELGWSPQTPFDAGVKKTVRWYCSV